MIETVYTSATAPFSWIDVTDPAEEELQDLASKYGLHPTSVADCLDPEHLPKHERIGQTTFIIVRSFDERAEPGADSIRSLTRKLAIFATDSVVLTIHRKEQRYLTELKQSFPDGLSPEEAPIALVPTLVTSALDTFWKPLDDAEALIGQQEESLFQKRDVTNVIREIYLMKRKLTVIRWMSRHTLDTIQRMRAPSDKAAPFVQDARESAESVFFAADELLEDVNSLINIQLSLASHHTNHVMHVLTMFSVFFMPLTFIVGVYGMNFEHMPELKWRYGYAFAWGLMLVTILGIYVWFRRKGWLQSTHGK